MAAYVCVPLTRSPQGLGWEREENGLVQWEICGVSRQPQDATQNCSQDCHLSYSPSASAWRGATRLQWAHSIAQRVSGGWGHPTATEGLLPAPLAGKHTALFQFLQTPYIGSGPELAVQEGEDLQSGAALICSREPGEKSLPRPPLAQGPALAPLRVAWFLGCQRGAAAALLQDTLWDGGGRSRTRPSRSLGYQTVALKSC